MPVPAKVQLLHDQLARMQAIVLIGGNVEDIGRQVKDISTTIGLDPNLYAPKFRNLMDYMVFLNLMIHRFLIEEMS